MTKLSLIVFVFFTIITYITITIMNNANASNDLAISLRYQSYSKEIKMHEESVRLIMEKASRNNSSNGSNSSNSKESSNILLNELFADKEIYSYPRPLLDIQNCKFRWVYHQEISSQDKPSQEKVSHNNFEGGPIADVSLLRIFETSVLLGDYFFDFQSKNLKDKFLESFFILKKICAARDDLMAKFISKIDNDIKNNFNPGIYQTTMFCADNYISPTNIPLIDLSASIGNFLGKNFLNLFSTKSLEEESSFSNFTNVMAEYSFTSLIKEYITKYSELDNPEKFLGDSSFLYDGNIDWWMKFRQLFYTEPKLILNVDLVKVANIFKQLRVALGSREELFRDFYRIISEDQSDFKNIIELIRQSVLKQDYILSLTHKKITLPDLYAFLRMEDHILWMFGNINFGKGLLDNKKNDKNISSLIKEHMELSKMRIKKIIEKMKKSGVSDIEKILLSKTKEHKIDENGKIIAPNVNEDFSCDGIYRSVGEIMKRMLKGH
ncbi:MAG: hypothetical protein HQK49_19955 [Oligoflexia bacterium]|nr:hypothetical protein [Oligoflexia bacterium]